MTLPQSAQAPPQGYFGLSSAARWADCSRSTIAAAIKRQGVQAHYLAGSSRPRYRVEDIASLILPESLVGTPESAHIARCARVREHPKEIS